MTELTADSLRLGLAIQGASALPAARLALERDVEPFVDEPGAHERDQAQAHISLLGHLGIGQGRAVFAFIDAEQDGCSAALLSGYPAAPQQQLELIALGECQTNDVTLGAHAGGLMGDEAYAITP